MDDCLNVDNFVWESNPVLDPEQESVASAIASIDPDWRKGVDISTDDLMTEFGLSGVQFGSLLPQDARQEWLNSAFDAMADLADIIGMKRRWVGLGGLELALSVQWYGNEKPHYETGQRTINLTRQNGDISLCHDWAHALDQRLAKTMGLPSQYCSQSIWKLKERLLSDRQIAIAKPMIAIHEVIKNKEKISDFMWRAMKISWQPGAGNFWHHSEEMFARGFEAYVEDELLKRGRPNDWLVQGTQEVEYMDNENMVCPYPQNGEREKLCSYYKELMSILANS